MKNKVKNIFALLTVVLATAIRSFFLLNMVNPTTGAVVNRYLPLMNYFDGAILLLIVVAFVLGICQKPTKSTFKEKSKALGVVSFIAAATYLYDAFTLLFKILGNFSTGSLFVVVIFALSIISALYFVSLGFSMFSKQSILPSSWLPLVVIIQSAVRLVFEYVGSVKNASISEHRFSILMCASLTLFWVVYTRFCNKNGKENRFIPALTLVALISIATTVIPRILVYVMPVFVPTLFARSNVFNANPLYFEDLAIFLFALVFIFYINKGNGEKSEEKEEIEETELQDTDTESKQTVENSEEKEEKSEVTDKIEELNEEDKFYGDIKGISGTVDADNKVMMETVFGKAEPTRKSVFQIAAEEQEDEVPKNNMFETVDEMPKVEEPVKQKKPFVVTIPEEKEKEPVKEVIIPEEKKIHLNVEPIKEEFYEDIKPTEETVTEVVSEIETAETVKQIEAEVEEEKTEEKTDVKTATAEDIIDNLLNDILSKYTEEN